MPTCSSLWIQFKINILINFSSIGFAIADSRSNLDHSSCYFNLFCINPLVAVWLIRSAYGMKQDLMEDLLYLCCLPRCYVNQIYQTTIRRKVPTTDGGREYNRQQLPNGCCKPTCRSWSYTCCCPQLVMADAINKAMDMPWFMGCCCLNPFAGCCLPFVICQDWIN